MYYLVYWLIVVLFALMSEDGVFVALSLAFDNNCGYSDTLSTLVKSPTSAAMIQAGRDSLECLWVPTKRSVSPILRTWAVRLHRLLTLPSPSAAPMLRLLRALKWLLIVAGDVELNPGPLPTEIQKLIPTVDASELTESDVHDVFDEVVTLAGRWQSVCNGLKLLPSDRDAIAISYPHNPKNCLMEVISKWLQRSYNTERYGPPTWKMLVLAVANPAGGENPALAKTIAESHRGTTERAGANSTIRSEKCGDPSTTIKSHMEYLRGIYKADIPIFLSVQWPPPPTRKVLNLAMIKGQNIDFGSRDEIARLTLHGRVNDILHKKISVKLEDIFRLDTAERKVILIEGAPGSGKSTLSWHMCQKWAAGELFQEYQTVVFVQLRDPELHTATSVEDILPAENRGQAARVVGQLQACRGRGLLWVLDGWDELPGHLRTNSIYQQLITTPAAFNQHFSAVVVTSRPVASGNLYRTITSRVEILGFTQTEVEDYFTEALGRDPQSVKKLLSYLQEQPVIEASCYLPLNAAIVAHLFLAQNQSLPTTLHGVFTSLVICCLVRHMTKEGQDSDISSLDNLPSCLQKSFNNICTLAYHGVMENKATFSVGDLKRFGLPQTPPTLGLIQGVESFTSFKKSVTYNFLHLSVQELLASLHISKLPGNEEVRIFKELFSQPRFAAVFQFYAAFTKLKATTILEIVADIVKQKDNPQLVHLLHGLYEAQDLSLCQFVVSHLDRKLNLYRTSLSPVDCISIGYFLRCVCSTISGEFSVQLGLCSLDSNRVSFLVNEFSKCNSSSDEHKSAVTDVGVQGSTELHLGLTLNEIRDDGAHILGQVLKFNQSLRSLNLYHNNIGATGAAAIAEGLSHNTSLVELSLLRNEIADDGAQALNKTLMVNQSLRTLDLGSNRIGDSGTAAIAQGLRQNKHLEVLSLYHNIITDNGAAALAGALKVSLSLKTLNLDMNQITDEGVKAICEALRDNQSLTELDLQYNNISDDGARALCAALRVNQSLTTLKLWGNPGISSESKSPLRKEFPGRVTIDY